MKEDDEFKEELKSIWKTCAFGLASLGALYSLLVAYETLRANFSRPANEESELEARVEENCEKSIDISSAMPYISQKDGSIIYIPKEIVKAITDSPLGKLPTGTVFSSIEKNYERVNGYQVLTENGFETVKEELLNNQKIKYE